MAEGKSKHPGLIKAAMADMSELKSDVGKAGPELKAVGSAATALKQAGDTAEKSYKDQLKYCEKIVEKYATKVNEIAEIEEDLKGAKGDKKAEADILKKHKKADAEADDLRDEYNEAVKVFATLSEVVDKALEAVGDAGDNLTGFTAHAAGG